MQTKQILLVDDEPDILEFLGYNLKKDGFEVFTASNGLDAIRLASEIRPQVVVLDVMMPEMDGIQACEEIRKLPQMDQAAIVFLTARGEDYSQLAGFAAGADDYITKPINPKLFITRIHAILRRLENTLEVPTTLLKTLEIDRERFLVRKEGRDFSLPKKEFELLELLTSKPNKVFSRSEIYRQIWGEDVVVGDRTIDVHVRRIRERLDIPNIKTVKGVGYKFEEL